LTGDTVTDLVKVSNVGHFAAANSSAVNPIIKSLCIQFDYKHLIKKV